MRSDLSQLFRRRRGFFMGRIRYIGKSHEVGWRITGLLSVWDREIAFVETVQTVRAAHHRFGNVTVPYQLTTSQHSIPGLIPGQHERHIGFLRRFGVIEKRTQRSEHLSMKDCPDRCSG